MYVRMRVHVCDADQGAAPVPRDPPLPHCVHAGGGQEVGVQAPRSWVVGTGVPPPSHVLSPCAVEDRPLSDVGACPRPFSEQEHPILGGGLW